MKVAIVGDGIAGRTLARLMRNEGIDFDLFGKRKYTKCGIRPCGFGTSRRMFDYVSRLGLFPMDYLLKQDDFIYLDDRKVKADIYGFDKPKFIHDLTPMLKIIYDEPDIREYDVVVDATGLDRAIIGPTVNEEVRFCYQHKVITTEVYPSFTAIRGGYLWTIPLGKNEMHIGGGYKGDRTTLKNMVDSFAKSKGEIVCSCASPIRLSGIAYPLVSGNVVAIGEAAGLVVPLSGEGNAPAVKSAFILFDTLMAGKPLTEYERAIEREFGWYNTARNVLPRLDSGNISLFDLFTFIKAFHSAGIYPGIGDLMYLRKRAAQLATEQ